MIRVMTYLTEAEHAALLKLAQRERRELRDQAALLIHQRLVELGVITDEES